MEALGFNVTAHRIAAYSFAALIAAVAGILLTWLNGQISPGTAGIGPVIDILIIAVVGGLRHPIGPFIGALIYVVLRTFALDALVAVGIAGERFQLLIGLGFLLIVLFSPDGVLGLWSRLARAPATRPEGALGMTSLTERTLRQPPPVDSRFCGNDGNGRPVRAPGPEVPSPDRGTVCRRGRAFAGMT